MIRAAMALVQRDVAVFPCRQRSKLPATAHGVLDASKDPEVVERWWRSNPSYNIAIATGAISNVFITDIDGLDAEGELRRLEAKHGALPSTVEAITGRGRHVYFKMPLDMDVRNSTSKIAPSIDIRGTGGYVLAPPSVHPTGRRYCWSVDTASTLADAPDWLLSKITNNSNGNGNGNGKTPPTEWRELIRGVGEGARDCTVAKLAGYLLRRQVDPFMVLQLLQSWNATCCAPPLLPMDIERIVNSIAGRELKRRGAE